ncbi:MAG: hypothetical protein MK106_14770 [Mariniblastus sp.]|nr:hypothetical protein [Mariniblastus sp.]
MAKHSKKRSAAFDYRRLETRQLLAVSVSLDGDGLLTILGDTNGNHVTITDIDNGQQVQVDVNGQGQYFYPIGALNQIKFHGGNGDDYFENQTNLDADAKGHADNDTLIGGGGNDRINGGPGNDVLSSPSGSNTLIGGHGDDLIEGGSGYDHALGGYGNDTILGGDGNDLISGDWGDDTLDGDLGNDEIRGFLGSDTIYGSDGDDAIYGQHGDDILYGDGGADRLRGGFGNDTIHGDAGNDWLGGDEDDDVMDGGEGDDTLFGYEGNDILKGDDGVDRLYGQNGDDDLSGGNGNDFLRGHDGNDILNGLDGRDRIAGDAGNDIAYGGSGNDILIGNDGDDILYGESGTDRIYGYHGDDTLRGGSDKDFLYGGFGADSLFGGQHNQMDQLMGQAGDDRFLVQEDDVIDDQSEVDAVIRFVNHTSSWSDVEIEVIDRGFAQLHQRTQNTRLLKDSVPSGELTFYKYLDLGNASAVNYLQWGGNTFHREIRFAEWNETVAWENDHIQSTVIHEIAHNWDSEMELTAVDSSWIGRWNNFTGLSDWTAINPNDSVNYSLSLDQQWWYSSNSTFFENYGRTNPYEDSATTWEFLFYGDSAGDAILQDKLDHVNALLNDLM